MFLKVKVSYKKFIAGRYFVVLSLGTRYVAINEQCTKVENSKETKMLYEFIQFLKYKHMNYQEIRHFGLGIKIFFHFKFKHDRR